MTATLDGNQALVDGLVCTLETGEGVAVFEPECIFDVNVPAWRFQMQGPNAFVDWWHQEVGGMGRVTTPRARRTATGFVLETEIEFAHHGLDLYARQVFLCEVAGDQISDVVVYCTGDWDPETRARQAAEAPMIRG